MRAVLAFFAGLVLAAPASAQIHQLGLQSEKLERKHAARMVEIHGRRGLLVEELNPVERGAGGFVLVANRLYQFYIQDPDDPGSLPYRQKRGKKVPVNQRRVLVLKGSEIAFLVPVMEQETFASLALENRRRREEMDTLRKLRDAKEPGSEEWIAVHRLFLRSADRLRAWLRATGYSGAAERLAVAMKKDGKRHGAKLGSERLAAAWDDIHPEEVPESLRLADQELNRGRSGFRVLRSPHFRIVFERRVAESRVTELLREAEAALEDFRVRHLDPRRADGDPDPIPEGLIMEFFFGPESREAFEGFFVLHYGQDWGADRDRQLERRGRDFHQLFDPHFVEYWRFGAETDLESIVLHGLGHALAELAWAGHYRPVTHDWLREALGYRVEWERRGRNVIVCVGMAPAGRYSAPGEREGLSGPAQGMRELIRKLALADPTPLPTLLLRQLHELTEENVAKAWTFFEWLVALPDGQGYAWLEELEDAGYRESGAFLRRMRDLTREIFGMTGARDPLLQLEDRWRRSLVPEEGPGQR